MKKVIFFLLILSSFSIASAQNIIEGERSLPVKGQHGMVVTSHYLATKAALETLQKGGNAVDAAVVAGFVLAVVQPRSGNIGGGGFMLISSEKKNKVISIDYREKAPLAATETMFLDKKGNVDTNKSWYSHQSSGVPGTVFGLLTALEKYGTISRKKALAPAIKLASKGFLVSPRFSEGLKLVAQRLKKNIPARKKFYKKDGSFYEIDNLFIQKDLAKTLRRIANKGKDGFYKGKTANLIVKSMQKNGGLITQKDLTDYQAILRKPVHGTYRGYDVYSMSPPSSGGVHIIQILNILENFDLKTSGLNCAM